MERALKREGVHDVEISENNDTTRALFHFLNLKRTPGKAETLVLVATEQRQYTNLRILDPTLVLIVLVRTSIEEHVLFPRVTMHITVQGDLTLPIHVLDQLFRVVDSRMQKSVRCRPLPI